jgi:hypothetical protein
MCRECDGRGFVACNAMPGWSPHIHGRERFSAPEKLPLESCALALGMAGGSPFFGSFSEEWGTARMRLNFEVIYPSAMIGTKAPLWKQRTRSREGRATRQF